MESKHHNLNKEAQSGIRIHKLRLKIQTCSELRVYNYTLGIEKIQYYARIN